MTIGMTVADKVGNTKCCYGGRTRSAGPCRIMGRTTHTYRTPDTHTFCMLKLKTPDARWVSFNFFFILI